MTVAVVGAGIFGAAAALELGLRGHRVTLFDAEAVPAPRAASTDVSKAIRRVWYAGDKAGYVDLVERSADRWHAWERETGRHVLHRTGHLSILSDAGPGSPPMYESVHLLRSRGAVEVQELGTAALRRRFPQFTVADDEVGVYDPWGGYLESAAAVRMIVDLADDAGVTVRERTPVAAVEERAGAVTVRADNSEQAFDRVVVAAGAWIGRLLPELARPLTVTLQEMLLLPAPDPVAFSYPRMPTWGAEPGGEEWYGFPLLREGSVKVARDRLGPAVDAEVDRAGTAAFAADAEAMLRRRLPALAGSAEAGGRICLYTMTPDAHFLIDRVPGTERLVVAGAGSGHAFKFGGVFGPLVAGVVEDRPDAAADPLRIGDRPDRWADV